MSSPAGAGTNRSSLQPSSCFILAAGGLYFGGILVPAITIDVTTVSQFYPSQSISLLNASGYIVAQRKAAVASKVTGRLVALMVEEGSKIKEGDVIARMENVDVSAVRDQAAANLNTVRATLGQARGRNGTTPGRSMSGTNSWLPKGTYPGPIMRRWRRGTGGQSKG